MLDDLMLRHLDKPMNQSEDTTRSVNLIFIQKAFTGLLDCMNAAHRPEFKMDRLSLAQLYQLHVELVDKTGNKESSPTLSNNKTLTDDECGLYLLCTIEKYGTMLGTISILYNVAHETMMTSWDIPTIHDFVRRRFGSECFGGSCNNLANYETEYAMWKMGDIDTVQYIEFLIATKLKVVGLLLTVQTLQKHSRSDSAVIFNICKSFTFRVALSMLRFKQSPKHFSTEHLTATSHGLHTLVHSDLSVGLKVRLPLISRIRFFFKALGLWQESRSMLKQRTGFYCK